MDAGILPTPTPTATPEERVCEQRSGWKTYTVQPGNTLFSIALAVDSNITELADANCLENINHIESGERLYVPRLPQGPVGGDSATLSVEGCSPQANITSPEPGQVLSGTFSVTGTAKLDNFWYYKIEVRPDHADIFNFYADSHASVEDDLLGQVDSEIFEEGLHWLRVSVVDRTGGIPPDAICTVPVLFD